MEAQVYSVLNGLKVQDLDRLGKEFGVKLGSGSKREKIFKLMKYGHLKSGRDQIGSGREIETDVGEFEIIGPDVEDFETSTKFSDLPDEPLRIMLDKLSMVDLIKACQTNKRITDLCQETPMLEEKLVLAKDLKKLNDFIIKTYKKKESKINQPPSAETMELINSFNSQRPWYERIIDRFRGRRVLPRRPLLWGRFIDYFPVYTIDELMNQKFLDLGGLDIEKLPPEIGRLKNLEQLNLRSNDLRELPSEVGNLTNLEWLYLDDNQFTEFPPEIGDLTNLKYLLLDDNYLTQIPEWISKLKNLTALAIRGNGIFNLPQGLLELEKLERIRLHTDIGDDPIINELARRGVNVEFA